MEKKQNNCRHRLAPVRSSEQLSGMEPPNQHRLLRLAATAVAGRLLAIATFLVVGQCCLQTAAQSLSPQFVDLLNGKAYVRRLLVALPGGVYSINGKTASGWVYYEASLQGETFWIKNLTNSVPGSAPPSVGFIEGTSATNYWIYYPYGTNHGLSSSSRTSKTREGVEDEVKRAYSLLQRACGLSQPIDAGSLVLKANNEFEARSDGSKLMGKFTVGEGGRPLKCQFTIDAYSDYDLLVTYDYTESPTNSPIPSKFVYTAINKPTKQMEGQLEYRILDCQFGKLQLPEDGFTPQFLDSDLTEAALVVRTFFSNSIPYYVENGKMVRIQPGTPHFTGFLGGWKGFLLISAVLTLPLLFWLVDRARKASNS